MRKSALASIFLAATCAHAFAADELTIEQGAAAYNWSGVYVGGQIGYGRARTAVTELDDYSFSGTGDDRFKFHADGAVGGFYAGYNWQFDSLVLGIEAEINASGIRNTVDNTMLPDDDESFSTRIGWYGTTRARAGYAIGRFLPYVTGGFAFGHVKSSYDDDDVGQDNHAIGSGTVSGWTLGAGAEFAMTDNWILRGEYQHLDLGRTRGSFSLGGGPYRYDFENKVDAFKVGVSYKF